MAAHSRVISIDLEFKGSKYEPLITFNRLYAGPRFNAHSYSLHSEGSEMRLDHLINSEVLIYDCIGSRHGRIRVNVDVSQFAEI